MQLGWDNQLLSWLNSAAFDLLDRDLLEQYVTLLRHLRRKVRGRKPVFRLQ